jgi:hypothetical protein
MASAAYVSLPFAEQIDFFRQKVDVSTAAWTDIYADEHDHAFMVAGARGEVLTDFRAAVDRFISEGRTLAEFRQEFDAIVARTGWAYNGGRNWRSRVIYETNLRQSYNAGREAQMERTKATRPYGLYRHGGSADPRPEHLAWNGLVLPLDDPWWATHSPQNGWGCKCKKFTLSERDVKRMGLQVAKQAPPIEWEERVVGSRGPSPRTVRVPRGIEPGFEHRPGTGWIEASTPRPIDGPPPVYVQTGGPKPPMPRARPLGIKPFSPAEPSEQAYAQAFLDEVGGIKGRQAFLYKDAAGELLPLSAELFRNHRGQWKGFKNGRHDYLHVLAGALSDPDEIWLTWQNFGDKGPTVLRRRYIRVLPGDEDGVAVFELGRSGWREITVFHVTDAIAKEHGFESAAAYIDWQREGLRLYARGESGQ